jgi:hypothetical protein
MPQPTVAEFWALLAASGLVDRGTVEAVRREHLADPAGCGGGTAPGIATWLVGRGLVTRWQAKRLAEGNRGPFFLGDYRLLERRDRERDSLLFTARHEPSGRIVSVVLLNAKQCRRIDVWTEIVQRTKAASQTTDPMLSRTWSLEQHEASRLIVCEHVEGTSLAAELAEHGPLPAVQAGVLASQIARAVAELHAVGGVHGGLSLDVLRREPPPGGVPRTGRVRLLQFPQAGDPQQVPLRPWHDEAALAALDQKAAYVAPELLLPGSVCDPRADVYAIGAILYALLSGSPPCWSGDAKETLRRAVREGPSPLGSPAVTQEFATVVGYLMARDPAERYQTAGEAADAIARCLGLAGGAGGSPARPAAAAERRARPAAAAVSGPAVAAAAGRPPSLLERRAARLRLIGGAITLAVLAGTATLVVSRIASKRRPAPTEAANGSPPAVVAPSPQGTAADQGQAGVGRGAAPPTPAAVPGEETRRDDASAPRGSIGETAADATSAAAARQVVVEDPTLPWASPTQGPAPRLAYLPPGSQLILLARPADMAADAEGALVLEALGPQAAAGLEQLAVWCGCESGEIEFVQAGWQVEAAAGLLGGYAVRLVAGRTVPADEAARREAWGVTTPVTVEGETIHRGGSFSFWVPAENEGRMLVITAETGAAVPGEPLISQVVRQAAAVRAAAADALQADVSREFEELAAMLDSDRHLTLCGAPHYLQTQGRVALVGPLGKLAEPLDELFGDTVKAAALSAHFGDNCYLELDAIASLDVPPKQLAARLASHVEGLGDSVERSCSELAASPAGRVLVLRLPQMLRLLVATMRSGAEGRGAILNAYLPRHAGHNLALATEFALARQPAAPMAAAAVTPSSAAASDALAKLERKITLEFAKDTLERSIQMIAEEIDVPMEIAGPDLQLEGITRNQSFGLEARDMPAREVLLEIMAKASSEGKLVYVVTRTDGVEAILITTRAAAARRGDTLPPGLEPAPAAFERR